MIFLTVLSVIFLDQISKFFVAKNLLLHQSVPVIKGFFHVTLVCNRGAAFGILKNQLNLFMLTSAAAIILISVTLLKRRRFKQISFYTISLAFILAGALGNLIDRILFGYVVDFLDFRIWPVFNVADSAITVGAIILSLSIFKKPKE